MEKGCYIKDIYPNSDITGVFVVTNPVLFQSRNGPYWRMFLTDSTGSIEARIWSPKSSEYSKIPAGTVARIQGRASLYRDQLQLTLNEFTLLDAEEIAQIAPQAFLPASELDIEQMYNDLRRLALEYLTYLPWRRFILSVLNDLAISERFKNCPGAKNMHHAWIGGLLEHTLGVARLCLAIAENYQELDKQVLLAGAILHDIGKIEEYSTSLAFEYTNAGSLLGHIVLGLDLIAPFLAKSSLPQPLQEHLRHLLASHHGEYEFGSPKLPQTPEALVLHYADNLDAKLCQFHEAFANEDTEFSAFTSWQKGMERKFFRALPTPGVNRRQNDKNEDDSQCLSLLKE